MKQTTVEQLEEYLAISLGPDRMRMLANEFEKAKQLEKDQIINAYHINPLESKWKNIGEQYYNETFNKK